MRDVFTTGIYYLGIQYRQDGVKTHRILSSLAYT